MNASASPQTVKGHAPSELVKKLRAEAEKNPAFNAVCHVWALRERARSQVMLSTLRIVMFREGFKYDRKAYENVIKFLASINVGKLDTDSNGRIRGLKEIKVTLQSIGLAGLSKADETIKYSARYNYKTLPAPAPVVKEIQAELPKEAPPKRMRFPISLTVTIADQSVNFPVSARLTLEEISKLMSQIEAQSLS